MSFEGYRVPAVDGAARVLFYVGEATEPVPFARIPSGAGLTRTTARRVVGSLLAAGLLEQAEDRRLRLGRAARRLGYLAQEQLGLRQAARGALAWLVQEIGETAHVGMRQGVKVELVDVVDAPEPTRVASRPGVMVDAHCSATGKVLLANQPEFFEALRQAHRRGLSRRTEGTITTWPALEAELARVRETGYAVDEEEYRPGVRCVAVPVIDSASRTVAAIGVTSSVERLPRARVVAVAKALGVASARMTAALAAAEAERAGKPPEG